MHFTGSEDADEAQRQIVQNEDGKIPWNLILETNIQRKVCTHQCISRSMDWAEGGSWANKSQSIYRLYNKAFYLYDPFAQ